MTQYFIRINENNVFKVNYFEIIKSLDIYTFSQLNVFGECNICNYREDLYLYKDDELLCDACLNNREF